MEAYYQQQSVSPYVAGHYCQRGSGFRALAAEIGRIAIPIAKNFLWPVAENFGRELFVQSEPEIVDLVAKKKSHKEALKLTVQKTVRKQVGDSRAQIGAVRGGNVHKKQKRSVPVKSQKNHSEKTTVTEKSVRFLFRSEKRKLIIASRGNTINSRSL